MDTSGALSFLEGITKELDKFRAAKKASTQEKKNEIKESPIKNEEKRKRDEEDEKEGKRSRRDSGCSYS